MVGTLAALSTLGTIYGAYQSAKAGREATDILKNQHRQAKQWYNNQYNSDYIGSTDTQAALTKQRDLLTEAYRQARGRNAVAGGSDDALLALKNSANQSVADATSSIAAGASSYKDSIKAAELAEAQAYATNMANIKAKQSAAIAQAAGQVGQTGANILASSVGTGADTGNWDWLMRKKRADGSGS